MAYTLGQAAQATGKSKTTIKRALEKGRISGRKSDSGEWQIEPVELHRVYPMQEQGTVSRHTLEITPENRGLQAKFEAVAQENAVLKEQHERERRQLQDTLNDLRRRLDQSEEERRRTQTQLTALLTDQREKEKQGPRSFWHWLTGR